MSTPQENLNLNPTMEKKLSDSEVLQKLQQIFGIRSHQDNPSEIQARLDLIQSSLKKLMTQYMMSNRNAVANNSTMPTPHMGLPYLQSRYITNIIINNYFLNQKNSYNFPQFNNQIINNCIYKQPNLEVWKGLCNQASSGFSQNPLHVCSLEINKENQNNFTSHKSDIKCKEIHYKQDKNTNVKKPQFISKKRSREFKKQSSTRKMIKYEKGNVVDESYFVENCKNKTEDSETFKLSLYDNGKNRSFEIIEEVCLNKEESTDKTSHESERSQSQLVNIESFKNSKEFMKYHFPVVYNNPDSSNSIDWTRKVKDTVTKRNYFQFPNYEENLNFQPSSESALPKKVWTPGFVDGIYLTF